MRAYGRITNPDGSQSWTVIQTDANGDSSYVYVVALAQTIKLNLNESPFWANYGIPAKIAVLQQLAPDFFMAKISSFYSQFFASLVLAKQPQPINDPTPRYKLNIVRRNGSIYQATIGT